MSYDQVCFIIVCILTSLGLLLNLPIFILHLIRRKLTKHPGSLLVLNILSHSFLLTHFFFIFPEDFGSKSLKCKFIGSYSIICYYTAWFSILFLCIEILIIFKLKLYKSANKRISLYMFLSVTLSLIIFFCYLATDSVGLSAYETCFIAKNSIGEKIDVVLLFFFYFCILYTYLSIRKQIDTHTYRTFRQFSIVIVLLLFFAGVNRILNIVMFIQRLKNNPRTDTELLFGNIFGILTSCVVASGRLAHPKVRKEILSVFKNRVKSEKLIEKPRIEEEMMKTILSYPKDITVDDIGDAFEKLEQWILVKILVVLTLKFKNFPESETIPKEFLSQNEKIEIKFDQSYFSKLSLEYNMPFIENYYCPNFTLVEYEPSLFIAIRSSLKMTNQVLVKSLLCYENLRRLVKINNPGGKSDSFFFSSKNKKIIIKTITASERDSFLAFLPFYSKRVIENPESKLVRILGLFHVSPNSQDFIIMENVLGNPKNSLIFDLKGSTSDRKIKGIDKKNPPKGVVMKDINFFKINRKVALKNSEKLVDVIVEDCKVLKDAGIMDYSLLVGFFEDVVENRYTIEGKYSIAIIDFFQRYGVRKSAEGLWKRYVTKKDKNVSSISPKKYFHRFKAFLSCVIVEEFSEKVSKD